MADILRASHVLIAGSREAEGFGLSALEAMACGVPCVLTAVPCYVGLDSPSDYAHFVPPRRPRALADGILKVMHDVQYRSFIVRRGLDVSRRHVLAEVGSKLASFFPVLQVMNKLFEAIIRLTASYANRLPLRSRLHSQLVMFGQKDVVREREAPANQNILVLAPHMDDEIFGAAAHSRSVHGNMLSSRWCTSPMVGKAMIVNMRPTNRPPTRFGSRIVLSKQGKPRREAFRSC